MRKFILFKVSFYNGDQKRYLQKLGSPQMEHELRVKAEILGESERRRVVWTKLAEFLAHLRIFEEGRSTESNIGGRSIIQISEH